MRLFLLLLLFPFPAFAFPVVFTYALTTYMPLLFGLLTTGSVLKGRIFLFVFIMAVLFFLIETSVNSRFDIANTIDANKPVLHNPSLSFSEFNHFTGDVSELPSRSVYKLYDKEPLLYSHDRYLSVADIEVIKDSITSATNNKIYIASSNPVLISNFMNALPRQLWPHVEFVQSSLFHSDAKKFELFDYKTLNDLPYSIADRLKHTNGKLFEDFTIIKVARGQPLDKTYVHNSIFIDADFIQFYDEGFWSNVSKEITNSHNLIIVLDMYQESANNIALDQISKHIDIANSYIVQDHYKLRNYTLRMDDLVTVKAFKNYSNYFTTSQLYARLNTEPVDNYSILCFTDACQQRWGSIGVKMNVNSVFRFTHKLQIDVETLLELKSRKIVISPENEQSGALAILLANELAQSGFQFEGYTYHYANYMGNVDIEDNTLSINDPFLSDYVSVQSLFTSSQSASEIDTIYVAIIFILIGLLSASKRPVVANTGLAIYVLSTLIVCHFFVSSEEYQNKILFSIIEVAVLSYIFTLIRFKKQQSALVFTLVMVAIVHLHLASQLFIASYCFYIIGFIINASFNSFQPDTIKNEGIKSISTKPFAPLLNKGVLIYDKNSLLDKSLKRGVPYILRSNHLSLHEYRQSGYFKSYEISVENKKEIAVLAFADIEKAIAPDQVCFWLQRKIDFKLKGVMQSIDHADLTKINISMDVGDTVTDGQSNSNYFISRFEKRNDSTLINKLKHQLKKIEKSCCGPVVVEFGITESNKVHVLQVKKQVADIDASILKDFVLGQYSAITNHCSCLLTTDIICKLTNNQVLPTPSGTYRKPCSVTKMAISLSLSNEILLAIEELRFTQDKTASYRFEKIRQVSKPFLDEYSSGVFSKDSISISKHDKLFDTIKLYISKYGAVDQYVLSKKPIVDVVDFKPLSDNISLSDTYNMIFGCILSKLVFEISNEFSLDLKSYSSLTNIDNDIAYKPALIHDSENLELRIIVSGDFSGQTVSLSEFLELNSEEWPEYVIKDSFIPVALMGTALKSKSIILTEGAVTSHVVITCKELSHPLMISI